MAKTELFVRKTSGGVFTVVNESLTTGNIYFVDSGSSTGGTSAGFGNSPDAPFTTIDSAINQTTANNGDVIYVMAGHSETLTGASAITCDVAGVTIIGLGRGTARPTLLLDAGASVSIVVSAANVRWENVIFSRSCRYYGSNRRVCSLGRVPQVRVEGEHHCRELPDLHPNQRKC